MNYKTVFSAVEAHKTFISVIKQILVNYVAFEVCTLLHICVYREKKANTHDFYFTYRKGMKFPFKWALADLCIWCRSPAIWPQICAILAQNGSNWRFFIFQRAVERKRGPYLILLALELESRVRDLPIAPWISRFFDWEHPSPKPQKCLKNKLKIAISDRRSWATILPGAYSDSSRDFTVVIPFSSF